MCSTIQAKSDPSEQVTGLPSSLTGSDKLLDRLQPFLTALCALFLLLSLFGLHPVMPYLSIAFGSIFALQAAWYAIKERSVDVNILMVLAAIGAIAVGHPEDAAALLFLFSLSSTLEAMAMGKTRSAIEGLIRLRPDTARRVLEDGDEQVRVTQLEIGDQVRVLPFEQIPIDGELIQGPASINESAMTGESEPVTKYEGDRLLAGTQNLDSMLVMRVTVAAHDTTLEKIVALVQEAQDNKASGERISQWFGQRYTFFVIGVFLFTLVIRLIVGTPGTTALYSALILLVALSPCALVISTPASTLSALAWAARRGILVRGGQFIEEAGRVDLIALDKTGTLTRGRPRLVEICVCQPAGELVHAGTGYCKQENACWHGGEQMSETALRVLAMAAAAEQYSTHPIAESIVAAARQQGLDIPEAEEHQAHSGLGVSAHVHGNLVKIGQRQFFEENQDLPGDFLCHVESIQAKGMTVAVMQWDGHYAALGVRDEPRPTAKSFLEGMERIGISRVVMLTGDTQQTARAVTSELGISEFEAGLMPQDKAERLERWIAEKHHVMMVGDGINDAPSLAKASIGVAMGGLGSDVALGAADVVLVQDRLERLPSLIQLGRMTNNIIRTNLIFATSIIVGLAVLSVIWSFVPFLTSLSKEMPLPLAVIGHEGSTVLVILNGLRLLRGPGTV